MQGCLNPLRRKLSQAVERRALVALCQRRVVEHAFGEHVDAAREGIRRTMGVATEPDVVFLRRWEQGIPNYPVGHLAAMEELFTRVARYPGLHLNCNAYRGIAMNDCVRNSRELAQRLCAA